MEVWVGEWKERTCASQWVTGALTPPSCNLTFESKDASEWKLIALEPLVLWFLCTSPLWDGTIISISQMNPLESRKWAQLGQSHTVREE